MRNHTNYKSSANEHAFSWSCELMNETKKFWRDKVYALLAWGLAAMMLVCGWSLDKHAYFEIGPFAQPGQDVAIEFDQDALTEAQREYIAADKIDDQLRAIFLVIFTTIFGAAFPIAINQIYKNHLSSLDGPHDDTIIDRRLAVAIARFFGWFTIAIGVAISIL